MRRVTVTTLAALALAGGSLAGCSSGGSEDPDAATGSAAITIETFAFEPTGLTIDAGATITVTNQDATEHTITAGTPDAPEPDRFDEEFAGAGDTAELTLGGAGTTAYFCELHPFMTGTIAVR